MSYDKVATEWFIIKSCTNLDEVVNDLVNCTHCHGPFCYCCFSLCVCVCVCVGVCVPTSFEKERYKQIHLGKKKKKKKRSHSTHYSLGNKIPHPTCTHPTPFLALASAQKHIFQTNNHLQTIQVVNKYLCLKCDRLQMDKRAEGLTVLHVHVHGKVPPSGRGSVLTHLSQEVDGLPRQQDLQPSSGHSQLQRPILSLGHLSGTISLSLSDMLQLCLPSSQSSRLVFSVSYS